MGIGFGRQSHRYGNFASSPARRVLRHTVFRIRTWRVGIPWRRERFRAEVGITARAIFATRDLFRRGFGTTAQAFCRRCSFGPRSRSPGARLLTQLAGIYFIITGLSSAVGPVVDMLFVTETWVARVGNLSAAAVWLAGGYVLVSRPQAVLQALTRQRAA